MSSSDEYFDICLECFDLFVTVNMKSWKKALSKNELPKPLKDIAKELGEKCRPACGCKMVSNEKIGNISECTQKCNKNQNILVCAGMSSHYVYFQCRLTSIKPPIQRLQLQLLSLIFRLLHDLEIISCKPK